MGRPAGLPVQEASQPDGSAPGMEAGRTSQGFEDSDMATLIAETACVDPRAEIAEGVEIGPYCVVGPDVKIGSNTRLIAHVCLLGVVEMGESNVISPFTVIGGDPQDVSYHGAPTRVEIGSHNVIREGVTINRATEKEDGSPGSAATTS